MEDIGLFEAIYSLPQITRYKPDPVPREALDKIIDAATKAPAHLRREEEIKALLGIPDHIETVALIAVGSPLGRFGPTSRRPAKEVTSYNRCGNRG